jgi:pimeloyl-ACP methyl ester carboxylesterase
VPYLHVNGLRLHYLEEGSGPPLVWLPGGNDHAGLMLHAHRRLAAHHRLICVDPRGQGRSDAPTGTRDYDPPCYVADLLGVLDALGLERPLLGGHSRGGRTVMEFSTRYPERARAAVAASSPHLGITPEREVRFDGYQKALREDGVDGFLPLLSGAPRHPERRAEYEAHIRAAGPDALIAQYDALRRLGPLTERLRDLKVPALFLCGDRDPLLSHSRAAAEAAPGGRLVMVEGAGHNIFAGAPEGYFAPLEAFLAEHSTPSREY